MTCAVGPVPSGRLPGTGWFVAACVAGLLHAAASLYWALGGTWLADTVGQWALDWRTSDPVGAGASLLAIAAVKAAAAVVPLVNHLRRIPFACLVRQVSWVGSVLLIAYGGLNTVAAWLVLAGTIRPDAPPDPVALSGHAALWDPLFLVWGLALFVGLWRTRALTAARSVSALVVGRGA